LDAATTANTASTIVMRNGSGDFTAGTITAALTGTASNASLLQNQNGAHYLARGNHSGTQAASTISDFDTQVRTNRLNQLTAPNADVSMASFKLTNLATPTLATDAATKAYADSIAQGLDVKESVRVASTANIANLNSVTTLDGVTLATGNRVLVKNQTTGANNGIYTWAANALTRATDADTSAKVTAGMFTFVEEGTTQADTGWVLTTNNPITLGTTALTFAQFSGSGEILAGDGLTKTGNTIDVVGTTNRISVAADSIDISASYVGQASITTLGTITTGTWTGTAIAVANGGTGATTAINARTNLGAVGKFAQDIGNGAATSFVLTHNLNTRDVQVNVYLNSGTYEQVVADVEHTSVNTVTVRTAVAPTANQYRVVVIG
jgi:phage-related tail fiber protein